MENKVNHSDSILDEFETTEIAQWMALVKSQLKGASIEERLVSQTPETIAVQPIYFTGKDPVTEKTASYPGEFPFTRGSTAAEYYAQPCITGINLKSDSIDKLNQILKHLPKRKKSLFHLTSGVPAIDLNSLSGLFDGLDIGSWSFCLDAGEDTIPQFGLFSAHPATSQRSGTIISDPYSRLLTSGKSNHIDRELNLLSDLMSFRGEQAPHWKVLGIDARVYHESGGTTVQELAFSIATAVEYLRNLFERGHSFNEIINQVHFNFATGSDFFMEIAKYRCIRALWAIVTKSFGITSGNQLRVNAFTSQWNKTLYDPHLNALRTTTESLSAILGGCNTLIVSAFDALTEESNQLSARLAQNTPYIITEESFCHKVLDPGGGSGMIESLTDQLGQKAWALFQEIEQIGGLIKAAKKGKIQDLIRCSAIEKVEALTKQSKISVGTNRFQDTTELAKSIYQLKPNTPRSATDSNFIAAILAELAEQLPDSLQSREWFRTVVKAFKKGATSFEISAVLNQTPDSALKSFSVTPLHIFRCSEKVEHLRKENKQ